MNFQNQKIKENKPKGAPIFSSTWVALFVMVRANMQQNRSV